MKINKFKTTSDTDSQPCELIVAYKIHEMEGGDIRSFLRQFEFDTQEELEKAIKTLLRVVTFDPYMVNQKKRSDDPVLDAIYKRFSKVWLDAQKYSVFPRTVAEEIWNGGYSRQRVNKLMKEMLAIKPDPKMFEDTKQIIQAEYGLTDEDMEKLHYFVEQCKAMSNFPNSHRRMLYIWGRAKKTGKTTAAACITEVLNGDLEPFHNASGYLTKLADEMQIGDFKVPLRSVNNCCMMDECFYKDMGKTYTDFKQMLTSSGGTSRRPYGQPFTWEGYPNYIATSNDPLKNFITDWDDRRYLSIEFKNKPKIPLTDLTQIKAIWAQYIVNSTPKTDWYTWADEIALIANEEGERSERMWEFANELKQSKFIARLLEIPDNEGNQRVYLKFFTDYFAESVGNVEAHRRREEIEAAVLAVFGERYAYQRWWKLDRLKNVAEQIDAKNKGITQPSQDSMLDEDTSGFEF